MDRKTAFEFVHRVRFTGDALDPANPLLRDVLKASRPGPARVIAFADSGLLDARPDLAGRIDAYFGAHADAIELADTVQSVPGGESCKNEPSLIDDMIAKIDDARICRRSYVLAVGGGAVLDAVGFAAAVTHRGVRLVRMPSTTLAQGDSGVGVKSGVNARGKKNLVGAFCPPWAVVNDSSLLTTLSERDWRSGFSEAVKVAVIKDGAYFEQIERAAPAIVARDPDASLPIIERSAHIHAEHITEGGDPFETLQARPLDFGHWSAHRIEELTRYEVRHGEAVATGIAIDTAYAAKTGLIDDATRDRIVGCLRTLGFDLSIPRVADTGSLLGGLEAFREHLGGELTVALPTSIGSSVDVHEIDEHAMIEAIEWVRALPERAEAAA